METKVIELAPGVTLEMVPIPGGSFMMGSPEDEVDRYDNEGPQHEVKVASFFMGRYPITQGQWRSVASLPAINCELNPDPSYFEGDNCPVEQVNWYEAVEFCQRLSQHTGQIYTLPSEAQWEYACRAGTNTPFHFGKTITTDLANYHRTNWPDGGKTYPGVYDQGPKGEYRKETTDVGSFPPNVFGLCDMHGNVWEWCLDYWQNSYNSAPNDGSAWITGGDSNFRILRGGSWNSFPKFCRCAYRTYNNPALSDYESGFRIVSMHL